jgi:hypothetical protein
MNPQELENEESQIEEYVYRFYDKSDKNTEPILDGIVDEEKYLNSKYRIAWILKEPYDENDGTGGGWSITKNVLNRKTLYPETIGNSHTFQPMIYITYSILNGFPPYSGGMDYIRDDPEMAECLKAIAWINISKMPALTRSSDPDIANKYQYWKPILHWQLKVYDPQILIFGNTFQHFFKDLFPENTKVTNGDCVDHIVKDKKLYISAYHPAQTTISRERYVQEIIDISKEWSSQATL